MKKVLAITIVLSLAIVAGAVVNLSLSIPDQHITRILDAMTTIAGTDAVLSFKARGDRQSDPNDPNSAYLVSSGSWGFSIAVQDPNETDKHFAKRFTKSLIRASVACVEMEADTLRYRSEVQAIDPPDVNVPDAMIE